MQVYNADKVDSDFIYTVVDCVLIDVNSKLSLFLSC